MRAHYLQHVSFEGLGSIAPWLESAGYALSSTRFFESPDLPEIEQIDLLVIMGGPMSVNDENMFPWLVQEKRFIRETIETGTPVLGICLGAQLIASAMGAKVFRNPQKEIGWFPVTRVPSSDTSAFLFPESAMVFHWHGETFDLPSGAVHLARSQGCENQAFQIGESVIGLQFHLETTPESVRELISHCRDELVPSRCIQTEMAMLSVDASRFKTINTLMDDFLHHLVSSDADH